MQTRAEKFAVLRQSLAACMPENELSRMVPLGHGAADAALRGGLRAGALHEVYARNVSHAAAASGFAGGVARLLGGNRYLCWIGTEFASQEFAAPNANGFFDLGIDPQRILLLRMSNGGDVLRASGDVLACGHVGALVIEAIGPLKALDLTASRRLVLAAAQKKVSVILLRIGVQPEASAAETRWLVHASASPPDEWSLPRFGVELLRNRHGDAGQWEMEWDCDHGFFKEAGKGCGAADHGDLASAPAGRPLAAQGGQLRAI